MPGVMPRLSIEIEEMDALELRFLEFIESRIPETTTFEVKAGGKRGGAANATIATVQAAMQRNPLWLNPKAKTAVAYAARGLFAATAGPRKQAEETIKALHMVSIGENVAAQKNPGGGSFRALTARYAAKKQRLHGFVTPILKATGDLLHGLHVEVRRT
jgi:hypothetical protein